MAKSSLGNRIFAGWAGDKIFTGEPNLCRVGRRHNLHWGTGSQVNNNLLFGQIFQVFLLIYIYIVTNMMLIDPPLHWLYYLSQNLFFACLFISG